MKISILSIFITRYTIGLANALNLSHCKCLEFIPFHVTANQASADNQIHMFYVLYYTGQNPTIQQPN